MLLLLLLLLVRGAIFLLLGKLCELYPEVMTPHSEGLISVFVRTLKSEMLSKTKKKPDLSVIGGALRGLCAYLVNFSQSAAEGVCVCMCVQVNISLCVHVYVCVCR